MSAAQMSPDAAWIVGAAISAGITAGPAYIAAKRVARKAESTEHAEVEHSVTRESFAEFAGKILGRLDEQRETLSEVRDWQAEHTTEHAVARLVSPLEIRKGK